MDINERIHKEWIGMAQPEGLVVTTAALKAAEANITWPVIELQLALKEMAGEGRVVLDTRTFVREILGWSDEFVVERDQLPESLKVTLDGGELLTPSFALRSVENESAFVLLVGTPTKWNADLDAASDDKRWTATPLQKFERLLRETKVNVGLLTNGKVFRLVYAPTGETAGWIDFRVENLLRVDGRELLGAMHMLLNERRLLTMESGEPGRPGKRLLDLLKASREYQNAVSVALREQVLGALRELLRGFEHADLIAKGRILGELRRENLQEVYAGLVTVLMRMVFVLFAEERTLLPMERDLYASSYSLTKLYAQLAEDHDRFGDGLDDRFGAWARVVTLFRILHDGAKAADGFVLPARKGDFFNPDAFPFLEGRGRGSARQVGEVLEVPRVSDGVVFRVLHQLLVLGSERLQYKGLDVEQIGSVYEGLMGFELEVAEGPSLCVTPEHVVVNLEDLLNLSGADRLKTLKMSAGLDLKDKSAAAVKSAPNVESLLAALSRRISVRQPGLISLGSLYLQPGEERRKSGSHYTPKSLTAPIVDAALRPIFDRLGTDVMPDQILGLKVCDPAMGSGAFLVEVCRQLAERLVAAWRRTNTMPELPSDEDPDRHARRLIAQRCLYGVDKNPLAVDLARLSMWLVTFAKEHPFTFVDHALRAGDSLVGLSKEQISSFGLEIAKGQQLETIRAVVNPAVARAEQLRSQIHSVGDPPDTALLVELWKDANDALGTVRLLGDLIVGAFFSEDSGKLRKQALEDLTTKVTAWLATGQYGTELRATVASLHHGAMLLSPFHWEVEFPEVFARKNPGFDCFVGNPPFLGGRHISGTFSKAYFAALQEQFPGGGGQGDLVAYFFRRSFSQLRESGTLGLVATNSIAQGDTRATGLRWIVKNGGTIFEATRRLPWPGAAAVMVSFVFVTRGSARDYRLDGATVPQITAFLLPAGGSDDPPRLRENSGRSFKGSMVSGDGFFFEDNNEEATPLGVMEQLVASEPRNKERIHPWLGGDEVLDDPQHRPRRYVIDFSDATAAEAAKWPDLFRIVERRVKPGRLAGRLKGAPWWKFERTRPELYRTIYGFSRILMHPFTSTHLAFAFLPSGTIVGSPHCVFAFDDYGVFALLQSRLHEIWVRTFASSLEDRLRYTPTDCFETFPFPSLPEGRMPLEEIGKVYYEFRADLMLRNQEGLTNTYNRFHNPEEASPGISELRRLHERMDREVLAAYGWRDIQIDYGFRRQLDENTRLTWSEETRDEVLARLLELNRVRVEAESKSDADKPKTVKSRSRKKTALVAETGDLFEKGKGE